MTHIGFRMRWSSHIRAITQYILCCLLSISTCFLLFLVKMSIPLCTNFAETLSKQYRDNIEPMLSRCPDIATYKMIAFPHIFVSHCHNHTAPQCSRATASKQNSFFIIEYVVFCVNHTADRRLLVLLWIIYDNTHQRGPHKSVDAMGCSCRPFPSWLALPNSTFPQWYINSTWYIVK